MNIHVRPVLITVSSVAMKSVMTVSALFRPARTAMMSELGLVYFLVKAASKKAVKVWLVSQWMRLQGPACSYLECNLVRGRLGLLNCVYGTAEELLGMRLDVQHFVGGHFAQDALQTCRVRAVQEELLPETLGELDIFVVVLYRVSPRLKLVWGHAHLE
jgi:hypothetical protein